MTASWLERVERPMVRHDEKRQTRRGSIAPSIITVAVAARLIQVSPASSRPRNRKRRQRTKWSRRAGVLGVAVALPALVALGGCGGDDGGEAASPEVTTAENEGVGDSAAAAASSNTDCPLTTEHVRAVVGKEVEPVDIATGCRWEYEEQDETTATLDYAYVTYTPLPAVALTEEGLDDVGARPVDGIGDEAWIVLPNALWVRAGDESFEIEVDTNAVDAADISLAEELALLGIAGR